MNPKFKKLVMISCASEHEESLELFVASINGIFRIAPVELDKADDGQCGLLLSNDSIIPDTVPLKRELTDAPSHPTRRTSVAKSGRTTTTNTENDTGKVRLGGDHDENGSFADGEQQQHHHQHHHHSTKQTNGWRKGSSADDQDDDEEEEEEEDDEEEEDIYLDEEEIIRQLSQQLIDLENEKKMLKTQNEEFQKKAVLLMTREKALQGQANPATGGNLVRSIQEGMGVASAGGEGGGIPASADPNAPATAGGEGNRPPVEQNLEKEKQYQDVLVLIIEERKKLNKQLKEFDQLALDLQTRLDDKEFKAKSIASSFKQFKK
jgi:hypothetical protein